MRPRTDGAGNGEPPVMWPSPGSGFEASAFSPAGRAQQFWAFTRGATDGGRRQRVARLVLVLVFVVVVVALAVSLLLAVIG